MNKVGQRITEDVSADEIKNDGTKMVKNGLRIAATLASIALIFGVVSTDVRLGHENEGYSGLPLWQKTGFVVGQLAAKTASMMGDTSAHERVRTDIHHAVQARTHHTEYSPK